MTAVSQGCVFRLAGTDDADRIAALHAASWASAYRGSFTDAYLDGPVATERRLLWRERFAHPQIGQIVVLAEDAGRLVGFVCAFADRDPRWGSLIDNLHTAPGDKGRGLGRGLMGEAAKLLGHVAPSRPVHLTVLAANRAAQGFYHRLGGRVVDQALTVEPDGSELAVLRYAWVSPADLLDRARGTAHPPPVEPVDIR